MSDDSVRIVHVASDGAETDVSAIITELMAAAAAKMDAMYNSDLELSWRNETERWHRACAAAFALPGVQESD